ncbi:spore germination protein GerW family protein [Chitinophagaceae bacterium LB-8]|jgi:uncharacterized spore protein YtfJ|uniref:Spore germination protein GerW family protein n=1 Tax=Paraflavisolibacter caeni TaxID=2982496 RepID=A0A9X2XZV5_9BACT|nr:spore germination protein GerW family protein [Paraflavisolibacter caeni]MCU7551986.1 spore germination protein GerW family protein [Paraflavisolibacter caeni]
MENENFVENLATPLSHNASVKSVFGEPIETQGKTIIPVAQVGYGFGGGFGQKHKNQSEKDPLNNEKGAGGGGGLFARAKGVYEVTPQTTRFIPAVNWSHLMIAALAGFFIRGWLTKR